MIIGPAIGRPRPLQPPRRVLAAMLLAALAALIATEARALAWGSDGHRIISTIATSHLEESVAGEIRDLLGEMSVADASIWADEIRNDPRYDWTRPLHYINAPRSAERIDLSRDGEDGRQVISAIVRFRDVLRDRSRSREERAEALRFLLHFVGDVHQPLHVSYKDDLGGNKLTLTAFGRRSNLHRAWDNDLIQRRLRDTRGGWATMSADLRQAITPAQQRRWSASLDPIEWANESLAITRRIYRSLPKPPHDIDDAYYEQWLPVVNERLQAAGVRLAALLNDALGPGGDSRRALESKGPAEPKSDEAREPPGNSAPAPAPGESAPGPPPAVPPGVQVGTGIMAWTAGRLR